MQHEAYPEVPPDFGNWLAGFIDGEGCFRIHRHVSRRGAVYYQCRFLITIRHDDRPILEEIRRILGVGTLCVNRRQYARNENHKPVSILYVDCRAGAARLVEILDRYPLRAKKARDYALWREAVLFWLARSHLGSSRRAGQGRDWGRVEELRRALMDGRRFEEELRGPPPELATPPPALFDEF
jgi:hypothetical protein